MKTPHAKAHPEVGHLIAAAIAVIMRVNPLCVVFEGADFNVLENRKRMCLNAVTEGMEFDGYMQSKVG